MLIGIVGKPSSGKSTFFKATTLAEVETANYPFTTIKPNHGIGNVKIKDIAQEIAKKPSNPREGFVLNSYRFVPVELLDVAGLVADAHKGKGMGNQFLDDLRQADALIHVVDISGSTNAAGESVDPLTHNPSEDIKFLEFELDMWYLQIIKKGWDKFSKQIAHDSKDISKSIAKQLSGLKVTEDMVKQEIKSLPEKTTSWTEEDIKKLATSLRKLTKPMIIAANKIDVPGSEKIYERVKKEFPDYLIIPCSAESELALKEAHKKNLIYYIPGDKKFEIKGQLSEKQEKALEFIKQNILFKYEFGTGIQEVLNESVFKLLNYIAIHPGGANKLEDSKGNVLPDCFLMPPNSTALDFAYKLHTNFGDTFIKAIDVKTKMVIGKDHKLKHLDIIEIYSQK